jgi:hypothetical protein
MRAMAALEEVACGVNEGRRRYEVVEEVLSAGAPLAELSPTDERHSASRA